MENNFKKFEEDLIAKHGEPPIKVKNNIDGSMNTIRSFADIIELFIPKFFELLQALLGGRSDANDKKPNT